MIFEGKCVVITGGGQGVGRGLVAGFVADGAKVVTIARSEADLAETNRLHGEERLHCVAGDVSRAEDVERLFSEAEEKFGQVDVLINNAAVYPKELFLESDMDEWARVIDINVNGMARCCHRALPGMLQRGYGRILNVGSFAWRGPIPTASAYSTSKGAVAALTKSIACEIDHERYPDVLVNEFLPGVIQTRMTPDRGDDPMDVYPRAKKVVCIPQGGPHGQAFRQGELIRQDPGMRSRVKRILKRLILRE